MVLCLFTGVNVSWTLGLQGTSNLDKENSGRNLAPWKSMEKPDSSYKFLISAVVSESHMYSYQCTVYRIPTSRDTCNHKRYSKHHIDSTHEKPLSSYCSLLIAQKLRHLSLGSLEKMVQVEHRVYIRQEKEHVGLGTIGL